MTKLEATLCLFFLAQAQGLKPSIFGGASGGQQQKTASLFGSSSTSSVFGSASNTTGQQGTILQLD